MKEELLYINFVVYRKVLKYWNTSLADWIVYLDLRYNSKDLTTFLTDLIVKLIKTELIFAFHSKKVFNGYQTQDFKLK